jgi:hypothetical protein
MEDTLRFCAILHNTVCAYRRSQYNGTRANRLRDEQGEVTDLPVLADEEVAARLTRPQSVKQKRKCFLVSAS